MSKYQPSIFQLTALLMAALASSTLAQFDVNGPNAAMTLQSIDPASDPAHDVRVLIPGDFHMHIDSGANANKGFLLLSSILQPTTFGVPTPWGGSIDIGTFSATTTLAGVTVVFDGISASTGSLFDYFARTNAGGDFDLHILAGNYLAGGRAAFQAIVLDPTMAPLGFDNTAAADANFLVGQQQIVAAGNDTQTTVNFVNGNVFHFHGQAYTSISVVSNGYISFGGPSAVPQLGATRDDIAFLNGQPAIAALLADWNPIAGGGQGVFYEEIGNQARIVWGDPMTHPIGGISHAGGVDLNRFAIVLELDDGANPIEGQFHIELTALDPTTVVDNGEGLFGQTPGGAAILGGNFDQNLRTGTLSNGVNQAQVEEHSPVGTGASTLGWDGLGTRRGYNDVTRNGNGARVDFIPNPPNFVTGDSGYSTVPLGTTPPDALQGYESLTPGPLSIAGGQSLILHGSFLNLAPTTGLPTIHLTEVATGMIFPCTFGGVLDSGNNSGVASVPNPTLNARDGQGALVTTAALGGSGSYLLSVIGEDGILRGTLNVSAVDPCAISQIFALPDDNFTAPLPLINSITFYGTIYTTLIINSNGYVTFVSGSGDFTESEAEFFSGFLATAATPNPGVACWYNDMNSGGIASGATYELIESTCTNRVTVTFRNMNHYNGILPAGTFSCFFDLNSPGSVTIDMSTFIAGTNALNNGIMGVTNGNPAVGAMTSLTAMGGFAAALGAYTSAATNDSICDYLAAGVQPPAVINFYDVTAGMGQFFIY